MAGLKRKYRGVVLLESLIAMVIILACVAIATTLFVNVINSNNILQRLRAYNELKKIAMQSVKNNDFIDVTIKTEVLTIYKSITISESSNNLVVIKLKAIDNQQRTIAVYNEIIQK